MTVQTINGYVLFPHLANWNEQVNWQRNWQTGLAMGIKGDETRQSMRSLPREQVSFVITPGTQQERAELDARLDAATKAGLACAPFWGRGAELTADTVNATNTAVLTSMAFGWQAGDYAFFLDSDLNFDAIQVEAVNDGTNTLTLTGNVSRTYPASTFIWPLLFGKFAPSSKAKALNADVADVQIAITEIVARHLADVGAAPAPGVGIGSMIIGSTFIVG
jgi:hypothetical protein